MNTDGPAPAEVQEETPPVVPRSDTPRDPAAAAVMQLAPSDAVSPVEPVRAPMPDRHIPHPADELSDMPQAAAIPRAGRRPEALPPREKSVALGAGGKDILRANRPTALIGPLPPAPPPTHGQSVWPGRTAWIEGTGSPTPRPQPRIRPPVDEKAAPRIIPPVLAAKEDQSPEPAGLPARIEAAEASIPRPESRRRPASEPPHFTSRSQGAPLVPRPPPAWVDTHPFAHHRRAESPRAEPPATPEGPRIEVRIGRVEVRAAHPPPSPAPLPQGPRGFDAYALVRSYVNRAGH
jgi:hypothetical protein